MTHTLPDWEDETALWPEMIATLIDFGLSRSTAQRLVGQPHVKQDMVNRWVHYCQLRGRDSHHGSNAFLITRLLRNDIPSPSWGALRRLKARLQTQPEAIP